MKPKAFLTVVLLMLISIFSWGQNPVRTITASFDKIPLSEAIKTIENTSDYRFFYEIENFDFTQKVSLKAKAMPAEQAVGKLLSTTDLDFKIVAQQIVLFKKKTAVTGHSGEVLVNGTIVDINGEPLIGVVVANESGSRSTVSDVDGKFSIKADGNDKLLVSCLGYNSQTLSPKSTMKIVLEESSMSLDALVVVGYGSQKKANLLGAVSQVTAEEFKDRPVSNLGKALQGAIPNLNITYGSGLPGQETGLNIRGVASINGSGAPLVLIDGVEGSIDRVNPNDVESVSVLKDAASAAIYGARAGFGVILITTKSSKDGTAHISYNGRFSFSEPTASTDFVTSGYYSALIVDEFSRSYNGSPYALYDGEDYRELWRRRNDKTENSARPWVVQKNGKYMYYGNFDWYNYLFDFTQPTWNHDLSISGGTDKFNYLISGNHYTKDGLYAQNTDKYKTNSLNMKFSSQVKSWLKINGSARMFTSNYKSPGYDF